ncbi:MAG: hypothetical protein WCP12_00825 [bacterium]
MAVFLVAYSGSYCFCRVAGVVVHRAPSILDYDNNGKLLVRYHTVGVGPLHPDSGIALRFCMVGKVFWPLCKIEERFLAYTLGDKVHFDRASLIEFGKHYAVALESIKGTLISRNWKLKPASYPKDCKNLPIACTRSADGREEYVHVLTPPVGNVRSVVLAKPLESFTSAYNLCTQNPVAMKTLPDGRLELTLDDKDQWHELDAVFGLVIAK